jgi:hypothetical protein
MSLVPAVTELMLAELLYLQYESNTRPIYLYINSTGVAVRRRQLRLLRLPCLARPAGACAQCEPCRAPPPPPRQRAQKGAGKLGYEAEAFAIYDTMKYIKPPVHTLCVGTAFGEAAMLLAAGEPVRCAAPCAMRRGGCLSNACLPGGGSVAGRLWSLEADRLAGWPPGVGPAPPRSECGLALGRGAPQPRPQMLCAYAGQACSAAVGVHHDPAAYPAIHADAGVGH